MFDLDHHKYHADRGLYMTSHRMIAARKSKENFVEDTKEQRKDTSAYYFGRAAHVYTLEGKQRFDAEYMVGGPVNPRTGKTYGVRTKKFKEWAKSQDLPAVTPEEMQLIERMHRSVMGKKAARQLLSKGYPEKTGRCEIEGVPCQVRLDWMTEDDRIVDYKTTADIGTIMVDCEQYGYPIQQAFYRQCVQIITGKLMPCYLIWCSKSEPFDSVVWRLDDERLDDEARKNVLMIIELKELFFKLRKELQL